MCYPRLLPISCPMLTDLPISFAAFCGTAKLCSATGPNPVPISFYRAIWRQSEHPARSLEFSRFRLGLRKTPSWLEYVGIQWNSFLLVITVNYPISIKTPPHQESRKKTSSKPQISEQFSRCFRSSPNSFCECGECGTGLTRIRPETLRKTIAGYSLCPEHPDFTVLPASSWEEKFSEIDGWVKMTFKNLWLIHVQQKPDFGYIMQSPDGQTRNNIYII